MATLARFGQTMYSGTVPILKVMGRFWQGATCTVIFPL